MGKPDNELYSMDLFAGAGGLSEGLRQAGFHGLYASEIVPVYANTYQINHPGCTTVERVNAAFSHVVLPEPGVYETAIRTALELP